MNGPIQPLFGGIAYFLPNMAPSTARLYQVSMHGAVGEDRFEMVHMAGEGPEGELLGDAIAWCADEETDQIYRERNFHDPELLTREEVVRVEADSLAEAVEAYPMLAALSCYSGEAPEVIGDQQIGTYNAFKRLEDSEIYLEPGLRRRKKD